MIKEHNYFIKLIAIWGLLILFNFITIYPQQSDTCSPAWNGNVLIDCETTANWSVESSSGASGFISSALGFIGNAIEFNWDIGTGEWVQAKYSFPQPVDLSQMDIFGLSLRGDGSYPKDIDLMFADINNVFYGAHFDAVNDIHIWMKNLALPKKLFYWYFQTNSNPDQQNIDWSHINRFFVVVKLPPDNRTHLEPGKLLVDHLQADCAANWDRQTQFYLVNSDTIAKNAAVNYIFSQQKSTGLLSSWKEDPNPTAWLYDQALALIVLSREGIWNSGIPQNEAALRAKELSDFIRSDQKSDGHWPRAWNPITGVELVDDQWVGDQAWWVIASAQYFAKSQDTAASVSLQNGADWLASKIGENGSLVPSTEANVDSWWAMIFTGHFTDADKIKFYLLNKVWDTEMHYWWRGLYNDSIPDPMVAMDCASWVGEFAKSSYVQQPGLALEAISFVDRALRTADSTGNICGFDGMGPVSIWCEGTAQYIVAGGENSQQYLDMLLSLQRSDGGMPGSLNDVTGNAFGWLSTWTGISSTAWLYFALTESPFKIDSTTAVENGFLHISDFKLYQNYPNPFNPNTVISYQLPVSSDVVLKVFDVLGNEIATLVDDYKPAGSYNVEFTINNLPAGRQGLQFSSGVYFYQLRASEYTAVKKMVLLK